MYKKIASFIFLITLCVVFVSTTSESYAEEKVKVTLPSFTVRLNENIVDNQHRQYPFLVYKDITYFPMTWFDSRLLGLETKWSNEDGLIIEQGKITSSYVPYKTNKKNNKNYTAAIPSFPINVNGMSIDNTKEEYPLLNFNNVTYFPLTWRFAHDEFRWEYEWDNRNGLSITSNNLKLKSVDLPVYAGYNDVAYFNGYYYYVETVDTTNNVYRTPENNASVKELVYSYEVSTSYGLNNSLTFEIRDKELWFFYHLGGAVMGSDVYCKVQENGRAIKALQGYLDFRETPIGTLVIRQFVPPGGNNLWLIPTGVEWEDGNTYGDPTLIYGWNVRKHNDGEGYNPNESTTIVGDDVYIIASTYPLEDANNNRLYKINLNTGKSEKVLDFEVKDFKIINDKVYYVKMKDRSLYISNLDGTNEEKIADNEVAQYRGWFDEIDRNVYYTVRTEDETVEEYNLYKVGEDEDKLVLKEPIRRVQKMGDEIVCLLAPEEDYGIKVFDRLGDLELAITDKVFDFFAHDDVILIVTEKGKTIKIVESKF